MVLKEFRVAHSTLIEHYQFMESHLEGIYAAALDKPFAEGLQEVEKGSLSGAVKEIKELERERNISVFSSEDYEALSQIIERRNFWCHCCYIEMAFDMQTGGPAKVQDIKQLLDDLKTAEEWREKLNTKKVELLKKKKTE